MNNKKYLNVGFLAVIIIIGAGVAYYCYPAEINNMIGIGAPQADVIADDASSSLLALDDGAAVDVATSADDISVAPAVSVVAPKKAAQKKSGVAVSASATAPSTTSVVQTGSAQVNKSASATVSVASATISAISKTTTSSVASSVLVALNVNVPAATIPVSPSVVAQNPDVNSSTDSTATTTNASLTLTDQATSSSQTYSSSTDSSSTDVVSADTTSTTSTDAPAPTTTPTNTAAGAASHILIAAVQIGGASSSNDLVKLYNPTVAAIDMSGWKLHKKSQTGTDYSLKEFPVGSTIAAGQFFVWANSTGGFSETAGANVSSTETLAADNSVALMDATGNIIDAVAWGTGTSQYGEGPPYPTSPGANQLLSRRSSDGMMVDTDNNTNDFTLQ